MRNSRLTAKAVLLFFVFSLFGVAPASAEERYPAVARLSFVSGDVTFSRGDDPDEWDDAVENVPLTVGDRLYAPENGRAEVQLSSGNFVRLAARTYLSTLNLSDDVKQFYIGEGAASFHIRQLPADEVFEIDTPSVSVTLEEPGRYRVAVDENGDSRITVRRGKATVAANGHQITVENSELRVYGVDSPRYEIVGLPAIDDFDRWAAGRDDRFERAYPDARRYASEDIIGAEELAEHGRWEQIPEYGYAWTPTVVAVGWAPFSNGRWYWKDPWGWSWISHERWGWATSHYGRWMPYRSRWYWVPVRPRTRTRYAPACVEFVRVRDHVGWFPLHPRDRHIPWWERRDHRFDRNVSSFNRNYVTVINHNHFVSARPVNRYIVRDAAILRDARVSHFSESLPIPNRSSLRVMSDDGRRRAHRPSDRVLEQVAVVRTSPPAPPRSFRDKLPEIEKNQGRAVEPPRLFVSADGDQGSRRVRVRPAAETDRGDFAPRNPTAGGPAPQPITEPRGKKLATGDSRANERGQKTPVAQQPAGAPPTSGQPSDRELERKQAQQSEEQRKAQLQKQRAERQAQEQKLRDFERRQAQQQKEEQRKIESQKQIAPEGQAAPRTREQQRLEELERESQREENRNVQKLERRQEQERREPLSHQQELQAQRQRQQEIERRQQAQRQQEQIRREQQLRQQQSLERQARERQQQQQEIERRQMQQQREQERAIQLQQRREQAQEQQLRQQQLQAQREALQLQRQQEQQLERRLPPRPQPQERAPALQPIPQAPR